MSTALEKLEQDALVLVNKARRAAGKKVLKKLPKGVRENLTSCPLAKALNFGGEMEGSNFRLPYKRCKIAKIYAKAWGKPWEKAEDEHDQHVVNCPKVLERFVTAFDNDELPHLDADL
jgi:hypothetical protein